MSTLSLDTIEGQTTAANVVIPGHVLQTVYNTPASGQTMTDVSSQSSITLNNSTTRGTATCSVTRKDANSFFIINIGCTIARATTAGEVRIGYQSVTDSLHGGTDTANPTALYEEEIKKSWVWDAHASKNHNDPMRMIIYMETFFYILAILQVYPT